MKRENGFTLIELLAVIVILAVISLVSIPIVLSIIERARKSAFLDSAYGIMKSAEAYYAESVLEGTLEDKTFLFDQENELKYSGVKPQGGMLLLSKSGEISMSVHNEKWCAIKSSLDKDIRLIKYEKETCKIPDGDELSLITVKDPKSETIEKGLNRSILEYFNVLSNNVTCTTNENIEITNTNVLDNGTHIIECVVTKEDGTTESASKTLIVETSEKVLDEEMMNNEVGKDGIIKTDNLGNKRYAGSNPNNWICFGIQNKTCDEEHLYRIIGVIDGKIKIIKNHMYKNKNIAWDTTGTTFGSNNWNRPAELKTELNGTGFYKNINYIDETSRGYISYATWYIGGKNGTASLSLFENSERKSSSFGNIGLISVTDFGYASSHNDCNSSVNLNKSNNVCMSDNWLKPTNIDSYWTITPSGGEASRVWFIKESAIYTYHANKEYSVRPSLYLKPEVKIIDGKGTKTEPYRLSI